MNVLCWGQNPTRVHKSNINTLRNYFYLFTLMNEFVLTKQLRITILFNDQAGTIYRYYNKPSYTKTSILSSHQFNIYFELCIPKLLQISTFTLFFLNFPFPLSLFLTSHTTSWSTLSSALCWFSCLRSFHYLISGTLLHSNSK